MVTHGDEEGSNPNMVNPYAYDVLKGFCCHHISSYGSPYLEPTREIGFSADSGQIPTLDCEYALSDTELLFSHEVDKLIT